MKVLFGLGNPGFKYENTRHNIGFILLNKLAEEFKLTFSASKLNCYFTEGKIKNFSFALIKPTTYVNQSGIAAKQVIEKYKIESKDFLVIADDLNLEQGKIRIRQSGGDGGHNGLHSIIYHLETEEFPRLRFGIGNEFDEGEMSNYVLCKISDEFISKQEFSFQFASELMKNFIQGGNKSMLNHFSKIQHKLKESSQNLNNEAN